jgi:predicted HTH transcriptional regulator
MSAENVERVRQLYERAIAKLEPRPQTSFAVIHVEGRDVAVIEVGKANGLVLAEGGAYTRVGVTIQPMTPSHVFQALILARAGQPDQLEVLSRAIAEQTNRIEDLSTALANGHSWHGKTIDYAIGGLVGLVLGSLLSLLV